MLRLCVRPVTNPTGEIVPPGGPSSGGVGRGHFGAAAGSPLWTVGELVAGCWLRGLAEEEGSVRRAEALTAAPLPCLSLYGSPRKWMDRCVGAGGGAWG